MGAKRQLESAPRDIAVTLPAALYEAVRAKAEQMNVTYDEAVAVLLRYGLDAQQQREAKLKSLVDDLRSADDDEDRHRLSDELGKELFGK